jgi:16S rRNA (guanine1207-N2)-methyltransferase
VTQYFDPSPSSASRPQTVELAVDDRRLLLQTDRGVFSAGRIDPGTQVLLDSVPAPPASGDLLDLGCGYGPLALALAVRSPDAQVWAVDVNERARALTAANASSAGLANVRVLAPSDVPPDVRFAAIWSNPPIRIGKAALQDLLLDWLGRLAPAAAAHLVVQKHLGSDSLQRWLIDQGYAAERVRSRKAYRVLEVRSPG